MLPVGNFPQQKSLLPMLCFLFAFIHLCISANHKLIGFSFTNYLIRMPLLGFYLVYPELELMNYILYCEILL